MKRAAVAALFFGLPAITPAELPNGCGIVMLPTQGVDLAVAAQEGGGQGEGAVRVGPGGNTQAW